MTAQVVLGAIHPWPQPQPFAGRVPLRHSGGTRQPRRGHLDKTDAGELAVPSAPWLCRALCLSPLRYGGVPGSPRATTAEQGDGAWQGPLTHSPHPPHRQIAAGAAETPARGCCYGNCNILQFH